MHVVLDLPPNRVVLFVDRLVQVGSILQCPADEVFYTFSYHHQLDGLMISMKPLTNVEWLLILHVDVGVGESEQVNSEFYNFPLEYERTSIDSGRPDPGS